MSFVSPRLARLLASGLLVLTLAACPGEPDPQPPTPTPSSVPDAARSTVTVSKAVGVRAGNKESVDVTVTVLTAAGAPLAGRTVTVSAEGATVVQAAGPTDAAGVAVAKVSSLDVGTRTVSVSVSDDAGAVVLNARPTLQFIVLPAAKLAFSAALAPVRAGEALAGFDVLVQNADGETMAGATNAVTLSIGSGPTGAQLTGTVTVAAIDGVAHFSGLVLERAAQGYTLLAHADGLASATSAAFDVAAGDVASLAIDPFTAPIVAGRQVDLAVSALDAFGNLATGYRGTVTFSATAGQNVLPGDHTFTAEDAGRFVVQGGLSLSRAGGDTVTVVDVDTPALTDTEGVTVLAAPAWKLAVTGVPASGLSVREPVLVTVAYLDPYDNHVTDAGPDVTLTLNKGALLGTTTRSTTDGLAQLSVSVAQQDTGYVLTASASGLQSGSSVAFSVIDDVAPAVPALVQTASTANTITAGFTAPGDDGAEGTATAYDLRWSYGPIDTDAQFAAATPVLTGAPRPCGSAESVKLSNMPFHTTVFVALKVTDDVGNSVRTASVPMSTPYLTATQVAFGVQPKDGQAGSALASVTVELRDADGFLVDTDSSAITLSVPGLPGFEPIVVQARNGVATFDTVRIDVAGVGYRLYATSGSLEPATSNPFGVTSGPATQLVLSGLGTETTAGASSRVTVAARDDYGNAVAGFAGTVTFASSDARATLPPAYTFTAADAGEHAFGVTLVSAGDQTLSVSSGLLQGATANTRVGSATPSSFALTLPTSTSAGAAVQARLEVRDGFGNRATQYTGTVRFTSTDARASLPAQYTFTAADAGLHTFDVTFLTSGDRSLLAEDVSGSPTGSVATTSVKWGAFSHVFPLVPATATAGEAFTYTVEARDAYDNVVEDWAGTVGFTSNDPRATLPARYTFALADRGQHQFSATLVRAGSSFINAYNVATGSGYAPNVTVSPASTSKLLLVSPAGPYVAGATMGVEVRALDAYDNLTPAYAGTLSFGSTDARAVLPGPSPLSAGKGTFDVTFKTSGSIRLAVQDVAQSALVTSATYSVSPAAPTRLAFTLQPTSGRTHRQLDPAYVAITDDYGNVVSVSSPSITVALVGGNAQAKLAGTTTRAPGGGVSSFVDLSVDQQGTGFVLRATAQDLAPVDSVAFNVVDDWYPDPAPLSLVSKTSVQVRLAWTAPGDDGVLGQAGNWELRWSTSPLSSDAFATASPYSAGGASAAPRTQQEYTVTGLTPSTLYYLGLRVVDDAGQASYAFTTVNTHANPCAGYTCSASAPTCAPDGVSRVTYTSTCVDVDNAPTCVEQPTSTVCPGTAAACFEGTCGTAPEPGPGQLTVSEVMHSPHAGTTEYVELTNTTDGLLDVSGVSVVASGWTVALGTPGVPRVVGPHETFVLAQNADVASNGGVRADLGYGTDRTLDAVGSLEVRRGGTLLRALWWTNDFPHRTGYAMSLAPAVVGTQAEDHAWYWCDATASDQMSGGDYGTPGLPNGSCGVDPQAPIDLCTINEPTAVPGTIPVGSTWATGSLVQALGLTDRRTTGNDQYPYLEGQFGYGSTTDAASGWVWKPITYDEAYAPAGSAADRMKTTMRYDFPGTYFYGYRYRTFDTDAQAWSAWTYCDRWSAIANGGTQSNSYALVTVSPSADHVVISEFAPNGYAGLNDQFIELHNPTNADISIEGWSLQYLVPGETAYRTDSWPLFGTLPAHGYKWYAVSYGGVSSGANGSYGWQLIKTAVGGTVRLARSGVSTAINDPLAVDTVSYGSASASSGGGTPIDPLVPIPGSYERKATYTSTAESMSTNGTEWFKGNDYDSDDSAFDFVRRSNREPQGAGTESP